MLDLAIRAGIPIIACTTTDLVNLPEVLTAISADRPVEAYGKTAKPHTVHYSVGDAVEPTKSLYDQLVSLNSTLILVNAEKTPFSFETGYLFPPKELMANYLEDVVPEEQISDYLRVLSGLTIKQMVEVVQLTQAKYGKMTPQLIMSTRAMVIGSAQGLTQVPIVGKEFYSADPELKEWVKTNKMFFLNSPDPRLIPRGLLFCGIPGVGKTQGAKYLARSLGVPLYRLDLSGSLGKYVGESEANLARVLTLIDNEEPCVLLIDEVEKMFTAKEDTGVTSRLLGQLLWWLQEHRSRVLSIMTTNDITVLPKELYRSGRIDKVFSLNPLSVSEAVSFAKLLLSSFPSHEGNENVLADISKEVLASADPHSKTISHADVVSCVHTVVKQNVLGAKGVRDDGSYST